MGGDFTSITAGVLPVRSASVGSVFDCKTVFSIHDWHFASPIKVRFGVLRGFSPLPGALVIAVAPRDLTVLASGGSSPPTKPYKGYSLVAINY